MSFCWQVRQHPRVAQVFAELYHVKPEDLLVSFDGFRFVLKGRNYQRGHWAHCDEGPGNQAKHPDYTCVQGSIAICSSMGAEDGDFVYWEGGNRYHTEYFKGKPAEVRLKADKTNWHVFSEEETAEMERAGHKRIRLMRRAGDMVLWLSRTPHQSDKPGPRAEHDAAVAFVSMAPRRFAAPGDLDKRIKAFEERRTTSHWPVQHFRCFPKTPRLYNASRVDVFKRGKKSLEQLKKQILLTPLGRRLVGYTH
jgi:hypothetical protein